MNKFNQVKKTKTIAIKNMDEELYRMVKAYASLEGRTIASIFEEAIRYWIEKRRNYEEARLWASLEQAYEEDLKIFNKNIPQLKKYREGYALICDGDFIGVFNNYVEVARRSRETCKLHALIIKLPYRKTKEIELGLPW
ncbi:MAG: hypothetical protein J7K21_04290 [Desulfurococcales archaeon]|nr:hypothetical protein [Desulfurococcales archaeon]